MKKEQSHEELARRSARLGSRPRVFEVFLEPTCPFSVKAFGKLDDLLDQTGEDRITIKLGLQSRPWHMYSG